MIINTETIFASLPSTRRTPPTMSICHNSIARDRPNADSRHASVCALLG
ncbi:MAG: hypothetical protein IPL07_22205 [Acidimicrobiaceae bacterium]|nr:hypothetical protein [Acidimicrobiaceae bacterium]